MHLISSSCTLPFQYDITVKSVWLVSKKQHCLFAYGACMCFFLQCCDIRNNGCLVIMNQSRVFVLACVTCNMSFALAEIDSVKLARLIFNKLCETCCHWLKEFPYRRRHLPYYETSIHAIKNMRRKMEDKHVVIPDFNTLFNLQV